MCVSYEEEDTCVSYEEDTARTYLDGVNTETLRVASTQISWGI